MPSDEANPKNPRRVGQKNQEPEQGLFYGVLAYLQRIIRSAGLTELVKSGEQEARPVSPFDYAPGPRLGAQFEGKCMIAVDERINGLPMLFFCLHETGLEFRQIIDAQEGRQ